MATVKDTALYILAFGNAADAEGGDLITNLKLQKLVYYCQGFSLAILGEQLFGERIEAWDHGPVCPPLYDAYKKYKAKPIPTCGISLDTSSFSKEQTDVIGEVYEVYGQYSAWRLREMTHQELPWLDTPRNEVITHEKMREFFLTQINV